ncbi:hypothetical protein KHA89_09500 [Bacillus sp. FJAT-49731]|uniref:Antigen I/II N-terminal domain-containing protein n=2 Tax=Lederbergia citrea TaxID=2833581 RepID=A0A942Z3M7_9BACI|nr:hypothetical protein [Lederbergia citrea]MBS4177745.1 hypothetical protein [Lederbergia citrea]MBS4223738.1 hypothetical protein [Lederbergia citrea]
MLCSFLAFVLVLASACGKEEESKKEDQVSKPIKEEEATDQEERGVEVDKGLLNVEITLPKDFIGDDNVDEIIAEAKADGVKDITKNDDGSLTYKMSKSVYNDLMKEMKAGTREYIEEIKNSEDFVSIKDITHNKSFSEFTLVVDQEAFENSFDGFAALGLGMTGLFYQVFAGITAEDAKATISVKDAETGEVFNTLVYPDDLPNDEDGEG